jgi:hypothetical protein
MTSVSVPRVAAGARTRPGARPAVVGRQRHALEWFGGGTALAFVVSFVGADVLELHHDLYLLIYFTIIGTFLATFFAHARRDLLSMFRMNLAWSVGVGAIVAFALTRTVLNDPSTTHPTGAFYVFELVWRGLAYGTLDALVLFMFPATIAFLLMNGDRSGTRRKLAFAGLTLVLSFGITATYHLGYAQFRGGDLVKPELGAVFANVPAMLTGNPAGAVLAHEVFHLTANTHAYHSGVFLPPDLTGYAERGGGTVGVGLAAAWIAVAGGLVWWQRRRLFPPADQTT